MAKTWAAEKVGLAFRLSVSNGAKAANAKSLAPRRATFNILPPESNVRDLVGARTQAILASTVGSTPAPPVNVSLIFDNFFLADAIFGTFPPGCRHSAF